MDMKKFGITSWDEETGNKRFQQGGERKRDSFLRLEDGPNPMRIVTKPHLYLSHKYKEKDEQGYGDKVACSAPLHGSCPLCDLKDRPKKRWYVGVIDRKTNEYKLLDISVTVYDAIKELNHDEDYGDPIRYDIDIKMNSKAGATGYYNVVPKPPKPLTDSDLAIIKANVNEEDLARRCTPPTPEWVLSRINTVREKKGLPALSVSAAKPSAAVPVVDHSSDDQSSDDDESFVFPAAQ